MFNEFRNGDVLIKIGEFNRYVVFRTNKYSYFLSGIGNDCQHAFGILKRKCHSQYLKVGREKMK